MGDIEVEHTVSAYGTSLTLGDLRNLLQECEGADTESPVRVENSSDQRDGNWGRVTVHVRKVRAAKMDPAYGLPR